jgi:hypothetical protein
MNERLPTASDAMLERLSTPTAVALFWIGFSIVFADQLLSSSTHARSAVTVEVSGISPADASQSAAPTGCTASRSRCSASICRTILRYVFSRDRHPSLRRVQAGRLQRRIAAFSYSLIFFIGWRRTSTITTPTRCRSSSSGLRQVTTVAYVDRPKPPHRSSALIGFGTIAK